MEVASFEKHLHDSGMKACQELEVKKIVVSGGK